MCYSSEFFFIFYNNFFLLNAEYPSSMAVCNAQDVADALPCCRKDRRKMGFRWKGQEGQLKVEWA